MIRSLAVLLLLVSITHQLCAQSEFMIHGRVRQPNGTADSILLTIRSSTDAEFKKDIYITGRGGYRVFMKYGNLYKFHFEKEGYLPLDFDVSTVLSQDRPQCCQLPLELSFRMIEPGTGFDSIFSGTFLNIEYDLNLKGYNYDIDIDYRVQKMLHQAQLDMQIEEQNVLRRKIIADSMAIENKYYSYISRGNAYYAAKNYTAARETFHNALELKPDRQYPKYKLEDIRTAEELFGNSPDSIISKPSVPKPAIRTFEIPKIPPFVYTAPSDETIKEQVNQDIVKKITSESASPEEAKARIAFVESSIKQSLTQEVTPKQIIATPDTSAAPIEEDEMEVNIPIVSSPIEKPTIAHQEESQEHKPSVFFDEHIYQDSLRQVYPDFKTEIIEQNLYKKTTRIYINKENRVTIFMKVEHSWGGIYYFIDRTPLVPENISQGFFDSETRSVEFLPNKE